MQIEQHKTSVYQKLAADEPRIWKWVLGFIIWTYLICSDKNGVGYYEKPFC